MYALSDVNQGAIGGVRALLVAPFASEALYTYATAERHTITAFSGISGWQLFDLTDAASASGNGKPSKGDWVYAHQLDLSAPGLTVPRAYISEALKAGPVVCLVQDMAGQWWLLGQAFGLLLQGAAWGMGSYKADTGQGWQLARTEPAAPRKVAQSFLNLIYNASTQFAAAPSA